MSHQSITNIDQLISSIKDNPLSKNQILATIPSELKKEYKTYQSKLRQQKYRETHKDVANERSRLKMVANRSQNPDKYKKMNSEYSKTYRNKIKTNTNLETVLDKIVNDITVGCTKTNNCKK